MAVQSRYVQLGGLDVQTLELLIDADRHVFVEKSKFDEIEKMGKFAHFNLKGI
jgi:hypothetical protein